MLWAAKYRDIIAKGRVNSPCCAPDGSRSSSIIAPAALVCQIPVTNCLIATDSQIHTECIYVVGKHAIVVVYSLENFFYLKFTLIHTHTNIYVSITTRFKIPARHAVSCGVLIFCQLQD